MAVGISFILLYPSCPWFRRQVWSSTWKSSKETNLHYHVPVMNSEWLHDWLSMIWCSSYPLLNMIHYTIPKKQLKIKFSLQCACLKLAEINLYYFACFLPKKTADLCSFWNVYRDFCVHFQLVYGLQNKPFLTDCKAGKREGCESALSTVISNFWIFCFHSLLLITEADFLIRTSFSMS